MKKQPRLADLDQLHPVLIELKSLIEKHDFTYAYSDDHRVWRRGQDSLQAIQLVTSKADEIGLGLAANELWNKYCPSFMRIVGTEDAQDEG